MELGGYTEGLSQSNPFPATVNPGEMSFGVMRLGLSYTRDLQSLIYAPWSITLAGAAARSFGVHSGLTVTEAGLNSMDAPAIDTTWGEYGAQLNANFTSHLSGFLGLSGTTAANPIGTILHANVGLGWAF